MKEKREKILLAAFAMINGFVEQRGCVDLSSPDDREIAFEAAIVMMANIILWRGGDLALVQLAADKIRAEVNEPIEGEWAVYSPGKAPRFYPGPSPRDRK